jgi:hypothetical protein
MTAPQAMHPQGLPRPACTPAAIRAALAAAPQLAQARKQLGLAPGEGRPGLASHLHRHRVHRRNRPAPFFRLRRRRHVRRKNTGNDEGLRLPAAAGYPQLAG